MIRFVIVRAKATDVFSNFSHLMSHLMSITIRSRGNLTIVLVGIVRPFDILLMSYTFSPLIVWNTRGIIAFA